MTDNFAGSSQEASAPTPPATGVNPTQTQFSDLARGRAQHQGAAQGAGTAANSGQTAPSGQESNERSGYIPRERFDEVNTKRIQAEAQLQQLTNQLSQAQAARAAQANQGHQATQAQQALQSPQVQNFMASLSSKEEQEKWRQKIINQPVTGIAELVQQAIQSESQQLVHQLQAALAPMQQFYMAQQGSVVQQYAQKRASDPTWSAIASTFDQLAQTAQQRGYSITPQVLEVIEAVARSQHNIPVYGQAAPQPPFTERPGSGQVQAPPAPPQLSEEQRKYARMFNMDESKYAADAAVLGGGSR